MREYYIPFLEDEEVDLSFRSEQVKRVIELWIEGKCLSCISYAVKKSEDVVFILLIDLVRQEKITARTHGYLGYCRRLCSQPNKKGRDTAWKQLSAQ